MIPNSPLELLDRITPIQCRAIARRMDSRGKPLTMAEIAQRAGLAVKRASWISRQNSWINIPVGEAGQFMNGCGITLRSQTAHLRYIKRTAERTWPMAHLNRLPIKERRTILKAL